MTKASNLRNAYTDSPEQHPNLILGTLQLMFWVVFHPSAFRNHLKRIDLSLELPRSTKRRWPKWRNWKLWRLLLQGFVITPMLTNLTLCIGFVFWTVINDGTLSSTAFGVATTSSVLFSVLFGVTTISSVLLGVLFSAAFGVTAGVTFGMALSVAVGLGFGVIAVIDGAVGEATSIATRVAVGVVFGVVFGVMRGVVRSGPTGFVVVAMAGFGGGLSLGFGGGLAFGTCLFLHTWSPVALFPLLILGGGCLQFLDGQVGTDSPYYFLRWHPAFWYEWQRLHWPGLAKHVLMVYERNQAEGQAALYYLSTSRQRWAAQAVQLELDARKLENFQTIQALSKTEEPNTALDSDNPGVAILRRFEAIGQDTSAALAQTSNYNQRLAFKDISDKLNSLVMELTRTDNKAAPRFRPIAQQWQTIVTQYCNQLAQTAEQNQDLDNPYITGVPLTQSQYIFVGRTDTCARIEQLLLDDRRPPLFLYGQRRTGKTSLLNNLGRLLPTRFIPTSVDLQGPTSKARDASGFLYNLAREISKTALYQRNLQLPKLSREALAADPFTTFDEWLDDVEQILDDKVGNGTLLLTLDEFEALDEALVKERFNEQDILGTLRNIIQHRPRIKVMIAGSHTLQEFHRWASYLINVQVIHLSYLKESEARQLIEHPTPDFALRYEPDAVQRILDLTRCQPYLVQLLCAELVAHKNDQDPSIRRLALRVDVEAVIEPAIDSGSFFFADIQNNQVDATGLAVLRSIAAGEWVGVSREKLEQQFEDGLSAAISQLQQRELIEPTGNGYKFQVEMIRRWFAREMTP